MVFITLSDSFYDGHANCKEILQKRTRPYACLTVRVDGVVFAIPFRHHIAHNHAFITFGQQGLDYTKAVVISDRSDIGKTGVQIESADYQALKGREALIANGMRKYVQLYKKAKRYPNSKHYANIISFSSLKYFEGSLHIQ